jgi:dTDP-4-amino-4,6-dideoxygalactose transaminase
VTIPFNKPSVAGRELEYVRAAIERGHISGDGAFTKRASRMLEEVIGGGKALLTTSCTHALEMAAILLNIEPGDEVIVPAFTFVSGINAFVVRGATPIFADVRADTLNIDEKRLKELISPRTKAIAPVHYAGVGCAMEDILSHGIDVVEDNAHGLFGRYRSRPLGSFGRLAVQSFHETKNVSCGEGGALIINDPALIDRAEVIREKGTDRSRFFRGLVDKYTWVDIGSSYLPSDMLAAYLVGQLEQADRIQSARRGIWLRYESELRGWATEHGIRLPIVPDDCDQAFHLFYLLLPGASDRDDLLAYLHKLGIWAVFHYLPLNASPMGTRFGARRGQCPVAESASERLIRLPLYNELSFQDQARIIEALLAWRV